MPEQVNHPVLLNKKGSITIEASKCEMKNACSLSLKGLPPKIYEQIDRCFLFGIFIA